MFDDDNARAKLEALHRTYLDAIREMVAPLREDDADAEAREQAEQAIHEDALDVKVRDDWRTPGHATEDGPSEFMILIATGGPAARIVGTLDAYGCIETATLQVQDWFQPWTECMTDEDDDEALCFYASQFYFGEG